MLSALQLSLHSSALCFRKMYLILAPGVGRSMEKLETNWQEDIWTSLWEREGQESEGRKWWCKWNKRQTGLSSWPERRKSLRWSQSLAFQGKWVVMPCFSHSALLSLCAEHPCICSLKYVLSAIYSPVSCCTLRHLIKLYSSSFRYDLPTKFLVVWRWEPSLTYCPIIISTRWPIPTHCFCGLILMISFVLDLCTITENKDVNCQL